MQTFLNILNSGGLWVIPLVLFAIGITIIIMGMKSAKSNSDQQVDLGSPNAHTEDNTGNVPLGQRGNLWPLVWGVGLIIVAIAVFIYLNAEYKGV